MSEPKILNQADQGLKIVAVKGDFSSSSISDARQVVKNETTKQVVAFLARWKITTVSGKVVTVQSVFDGYVMHGANKIEPGATYESRTSGGMSNIQEAISDIEVSMEYVRYGDDSYWGEGNGKFANYLKAKKEAMAALKTKLNATRQAKGLQAMMDELEELAKDNSGKSMLEPSVMVIVQLHVFVKHRYDSGRIDEILVELNN